MKIKDFVQKIQDLTYKYQNDGNAGNFLDELFYYLRELIIRKENE